MTANRDKPDSGTTLGQVDQVFDRLGRSRFRSRIRLGTKELRYLKAKGLGVIKEHACDFVRQRLGPAFPANDGKQTPMRNHLVFVAQHATATCCRKCLKKWHHIETGKALTPEQIDYIVLVITRWLERELDEKDA